MPTATEHISRAYELSRLERHELALQEVQRALEEDPNSAEAHACGAWVLREQGRLPEAEQAARAALAADPHLVQAHNALACTLWSRARLREADTAFQALLACQFDPDRALHLTNYARFLNANGRYRESLTITDRALTLAPTRAAIHEVRGTSLRRLDDLAGAEVAYREALRLNPRLGAAHQALGELELMQGHGSAAFESFREALRLDPNNRTARENLAVALRARHRLYGLLLLLTLRTTSRKWSRRIGIGAVLLFFVPPLIGAIFDPRADSESGGPIFDAWIVIVFGMIALFVVGSTWRRIMDPVFNTLLQFDPLAREVLEYDRADGVSVGLMILAFLGLLSFGGSVLVLGVDHPVSEALFMVSLVSALAMFFPYGIRGTHGTRRRTLWAGFVAAVLGMGLGAVGLIVERDALCGLGFLVGGGGTIVYLIGLPGALNTRYNWVPTYTRYGSVALYQLYRNQPATQRRWQAALIIIGIFTFSVGTVITESFLGATFLTLDALFTAALLISLALPQEKNPMHNSPLYQLWVFERNEAVARRYYLLLLASITAIFIIVTLILLNLNL